MDAKRSRISAVLTILWYWYSTNSHRANGLGRLSRLLSSHQTISRYPLPDSCLQLGPNHLFVIPILSPFEMDVIPGFARVGLSSRKLKLLHYKRSGNSCLTHLSASIGNRKWKAVTTAI